MQSGQSTTAAAQRSGRTRVPAFLLPELAPDPIREIVDQAVCLGVGTWSESLKFSQGAVAEYSILDGARLAGELPPNKHRLVGAWIEIHREDLLADWELAVHGKRLFPIKGLDQ